MNNINSTINKSLIVGGLVASLSACGGSGSSPAPVVAPIVVGSNGLTLEEVVMKFDVAGGLNLTQNVSGNVSYGSGDDIITKDFSFSVENSNGSKVCVNYTGKNDSSVVANSFKFNSLNCDRSLSVGGNADVDEVLNNLINYSAGAVVNSPVSAEYGIYDGSSFSFSAKNIDISSCSDSVTGGSDYVAVSAGTDGKTNVELYSGIYGNELSAGNTFSVSCEGTDVNGDLVNFEDVASLTAIYTSIPANDLVDIIKRATGSTMTESTENKFDMSNGYNSIIDVNFVSGSSVGYDVQTDGVGGADVRLNVGTGSDFYKTGSSSESDAVFNDLLNRIGTPVLDRTRDFAVPLIDHEDYVLDRAEFNIKNVSNDNLTCSFDDLPRYFKSAIIGSELTSNGFNQFYIEKEPGKNTTNPKYIDENGNYDITNIICSGLTLENSVFEIEIGRFKGNDNDDHAKYPKY
jgi:hypothetical protein